MADILDGEQLKRNILSDMRVELTEEFDKNFERKAFFNSKWKKRGAKKQVSKTHNKTKHAFIILFIKRTKKTNCFYYLCSFN